MLWDGTNTSPAVVQGAETLAESGGVPYILRSPDELAGCFEGLVPVEPGLVPITPVACEPLTGGEVGGMAAQVGEVGL